VRSSQLFVLAGEGSERTVVDALHQQGLDVVVETIVHAEALEVGLEGDLRPLLAPFVGLFADLRLALGAHVVAEGLLIDLAGVGVGGLDDELGRIYVRELGAVAVATSGDLRACAE
jgi:hypothetical protein